MPNSIDPEEPGADWAALLDGIVAAVAALVGLADDSMLDSRSWRFLDMGRRIERAIFTSGLLQHTIVNPGDDPQLLQSVVEITESSFPYRRRYLARLEVHAIVDLLLADETNPRAIAFQLARVSQHLSALPRDPAHPNGDHDQEMLAELRDAIQMADLLQLSVLSADSGRDELGAFLKDVSERAGQISEAIAQLYFTHAAVARDLGQIGEEPGA